MQPLEAGDLLVDPVRSGGGRRAEHDQEARRLDRFLDFLAKVGRCRQLMPVAEDRRQPLGHHALVGQLADQPGRNAKFLQRLVQPIGDRRVLVAVAEERHVALLVGRGAARASKAPAQRSRQLGKLDHRPPPLESR